jgi:hypothetical protein
MTTDINSTSHEHDERKLRYTSAASAPVYGIGLIGAWIYYLSHATTFWLGVLGIFKGIFWPAMLVYKLLEFLKM